jgi:hypothetical protein
MEDNYFHLEPDATHTIMLEKSIPGTPARGIVRALNMSGAVRFAVPG